MAKSNKDTNVFLIWPLKISVNLKHKSIYDNEGWKRVPTFLCSLRHSFFLTFSEDSVVIYVPIFNSFYYNLLIKALEPHKEWTSRNVEICPKKRSNAAKGLH